MDIVEFVEQLCGIKLMEYQKMFLRRFAEMKNVSIAYLPNGKVTLIEREETNEEN